MHINTNFDVIWNVNCQSMTYDWLKIGLKTQKKTNISDSFIVQNQIMTLHSNSNYTPIIIVKWTKNFNLPTKTVKNGCLVVYRPNNAKKSISDSLGGQNQILTPHSGCNYTPNTIVQRTQNMNRTTKTVKNGCSGVFRSKNAKNTHYRQF